MRGIFELERDWVKGIKVLFLVFLSLLSLCAVSTQPVKSQTMGIIYIASDGSVYSSTNVTVPIQRVGDVYTFSDNIMGYTLLVQRDNIVIDGAGYILSGQGDFGIDLSYRSNVTIKNVQTAGFFYSIYLWNSLGNIITGNTITNNGYGIFVLESSQNTITGNTLTNNEVGIDLRSSSYNILRNNVMNNNHNLAVYGAALSHFVNDVDTSNTIDGKKVYYLVDENNLFISPSTFPDVGFLALVSCTNITVQGLELTKNGHGVIIAFTTGSTITQNHVIENFNGIGLFSSSGNYVFSNNIEDNYRGIQLSNSSNSNSIAGNNITDNTEGIFLFDSSFNGIDSNNITDNDLGIGFSSASNNMIRRNYFIDNEKQFYDSHMDESSIATSMNIWGSGYPLGGNYWSDYTGVDVKSGPNQDQSGSDGLGDTPYIIYENITDNYPLLPFGSPPAISITSPQNKTYTVNSVSLSFTVSESTSWTAYSLDGQANVDITGETTLRGLSAGSHHVTVYAKDTDGNEGSTTVYFTVAEGASSSEAFPIIILVPIIVAVIGVILLFYLLRRKKKAE